MPTIRQRIANVLLGDEIRKLNQSTHTLYEAYLSGPFQLPPDQLLRQLREYDSAVIQDLVTQMGYDYLGGLGSYNVNPSDELKRAIDESQRLFRYAPLAQWAVEVWTNFGLGEGVKIICDDANADEVWQECWTAERNADLFSSDRLHELSNWTMTDGNLFLAAYAAVLDGQVTYALLPTSEITEIVTHPQNANKPLFYKRVYTEGTASKTLYYPAWQAYFEGEDTLAKATLPNGAVRADKIADDKTTVCVLHIAHNRKIINSLWGWPKLYIGAPYARSHKQFMDGRLAVAAAVAMFVDKVKVQGGSRAIDAARAKLNSTLTASNYDESNPPPASGATWLENSAADRSRFPLTSGASDAKTDNDMFAWMSLIGWGLFPTTAGMDTSRWATALAMDKTQAMQWSRYQTFWKAQFQNMVKVALNFAEKYPQDSNKFDTKTSQVIIDSLSTVDFPGVAESISQLLGQISQLTTAGILPTEAGKRIAQEFFRVTLRALDVTNDDVTSDVTFGITPNEIPAEVDHMMKKAIAKYQRGEMSADSAAQFLLAELIENHK